jgi:Asp-tRNA(Asn)/Glu-tRNA(Gln) amidotransferase A subunit family amidase
MKKNKANRAKRASVAGPIDRRSFVKTLPALVAAGLATTKTAGAQAPAASDQSSPIATETLHAAEQIIGIELTQPQETMALNGVRRSLGAYTALRKLDVPLDTETAFSFHPALPGKKLIPGPGSLKLRKSLATGPKAPEEVAFAPVTELAARIRSRQISSVELTRMYLNRLKRYGPKLYCTVTLTEELAMSQAEKADSEIKSGHYRGPLHGIPWGAKDLFATKGIKTTWGAEPYRDQVIDYDATVVERLNAAGAVLIAKLSLGALAQGSRWFGGNTRNPWNIDQSSSGSSAGPAAATAAGLVGFSIGTETLGSIVSPSSTCGVTGLRPTFGRVSRYGAMALCWTMDKIGPICRSVEDCAAVLHAIYGPDGRDLTVADAAFNWPPPAKIDKMRIGLVKADFDAIEGEAKDSYQRALDALRSAGAKLEPVELPKFAADSLMVILNAEAAAAFDDLTRNGGINQLSGQSPGDWPNQFRTARFIPAVEYIRAQRARLLLMQQMDKLMSGLDVLVTPTRSRSLIITNFTGHPAVVTPCGLVSGRPQSLMFTSGLYDEASALQAALAFEDATEWHNKHPKVDWVSRES